MGKLRSVVTLPKQSITAMKVALGVRARSATFIAVTLLMITQVIGVIIFAGKSYAYAPNEFVTTWKTDNPGTSAANQINLPIIGTNYDVDWGDGNIQTGNTTNPDYVGGPLTHTYASPGTYTIKVTGQFSRVVCSGAYNDCVGKLLSVDQWGSNQWSSMEGAFAGANNLQIVATDTPDLSNVTSMKSMFIGSDNFNSSINSWDTSNVTDMSYMFASTDSFNQPLDNWNTSSVTDMTAMFWSAKSFNQPLNSWDVSSVTDMGDMFGLAGNFNQPLNNWNTSNVTDMSLMFRGNWVNNQRVGSFNQDISSWDTSNVTTMAGMFDSNTVFNQPVNDWNTSNVTSMAGMFQGATAFNQPLNNWDTSKVTDMANMFTSAIQFNQPLNNWNTSNVTRMASMFALAIFNQPLTSWNVSKVTNMSYMFLGNPNFDQTLAGWDMSSVTNMSFMFTGSIYAEYYPPAGLSAANYDDTLVSWSQQNLQNGVTFDAGKSKYCSAGTQRQSIINLHGWTINDEGVECAPPVTEPVITPEVINPPGTELPPELAIPELPEITSPNPEIPVIIPKPNSIKAQIAPPASSNSLLALAKRIPEPLAIGFPWLLLLLALVLVAIQYYQVRSESLATKRLQKSIEQQRRLVEEQNNFVALSTHYLHTPLTVMEGEISLMVKAGTITEKEATKLKATLSSLNAEAEATLAQEEQNKVE